MDRACPVVPGGLDAPLCTMMTTPSPLPWGVRYQWTEPVRGSRWTRRSTLYHDDYPLPSTMRVKVPVDRACPVVPGGLDAPLCTMMTTPSPLPWGVRYQWTEPVRGSRWTRRSTLYHDDYPLPSTMRVKVPVDRACPRFQVD